MATLDEIKEILIKLAQGTATEFHFASCSLLERLYPLGLYSIP
jgi:hypothetical protein